MPVAVHHVRPFVTPSFMKQQNSVAQLFTIHFVTFFFLIIFLAQILNVVSLIGVLLYLLGYLPIFVPLVQHT